MPSAEPPVSDAPKAAPAFCRGCRYDLAGIDWTPATCPECGRAFDPADPSTTLPTPSPPMSGAVHRFGVPLAVALLILTAAIHTVIPRPADLQDWRLWLWFGQRYGVQAGWTAGWPSKTSWWGGRRTAIRAYDGAGKPVWEVTWSWPDRWTIQTHRPQVRWSDLSAAFNDIKPDMFGVLIEPAASDAALEPFIVQGSKVEVFSSIVQMYGLETRPFLLRLDQPYVWVYDRDRRRMVAISRETAASLGYEIDLWVRGERPEPLVPPEGGRLETTATPAPPNPAPRG